MESGIAAGSATLRPGDSGNPDSPKVNDWSSGAMLDQATMTSIFNRKLTI
ncbi:hypothetical protein KUH03_36340 [Sphingobacterium sp. E70]|nr:hypothetical protein [Sphingobacterium sp. E70]ULT24414.1 hypothetical protein KUH03_36340 [Sphingobacterium sp. E70]